MIVRTSVCVPDRCTRYLFSDKNVDFHVREIDSHFGVREREQNTRGGFGVVPKSL